MKKTFLAVLLGASLPSAVLAQHWSLTWKQMQSVTPGLELVGRIETRPSRELANPRWSVGCECLDREYADFSAYKPYVGELGVGAARIQSGWARCEQKKGRYDFEWLDEAVNGLCEEGVRPWMCLAYGNPIYGAQKNLGSRIFTDEPTLQAWERYVTAVAERYKDRVHEWEVWNEPNLRGADQSAAYAELLIRTAEALRKVDPEAVVIGFGLSRMPIDFTSRVLDILRERGKLGLLDYVSFHPYHENPDDATPGIEALGKLVSSYDPRIRLFSGESGCPSVLEWAHALRYHEWSEYSQAKWVARRLANDFALGIRSSIFAIIDNQYPNMLQSFGLLRANLLKQVVYKRPSYHAMQHMVNLLHAGVKAAGRPVFSVNTAREIALVELADATDKPIGVMFWYADRIPSDELAWDRVELRVEGLSLKDPVLVEPITGRVFELPQPHGNRDGGRMKFTGCPVWDAPMLLIERSAVPFQGATAERRAAGSSVDMLY
ncbi:MAG TPA: beta-galactosidase [Candidatus Alistipes intestinigallinarum]|uniref:Beta-galactosidase n=1 Tax=Candidatus Alistipes intestinigallinarum TaxID=2838440 RepID=A0A9D1YZA0_9BACT|nr:beta-galactosidase [Candidatus Alistipes intestinigallinarum]